MDLEEYEFNKAKLLAEIDQPYIMHNPELAREFFERLKSDLPDVCFFEKKISQREVATQYIVAGGHARAVLLVTLTGKQHGITKELQEIDQLIDQLMREISRKGDIA